MSGAGVVAIVLATILATAASVSVFWVARVRRSDRERARAVQLAHQREVDGEGLAEERERVEAALDGIAEGVVVVDSKGSVVFRNAVAEGFAGGRHADALVDVAVSELAADAVRGSSEARELDLYGPPRRSLVLSARPLVREAEVLGAMVVIDDVTDRRQLEGVRRDFVANISHELRTPVGALILVAETLVGERDDEVRQRLAQRLLTEATRMAGTIDDLLELGTIESGEATARALVPIDDVLADAAGRIAPVAEQHAIALDLPAANRRLAVQGDRRQLASAVFNLLDNAVKYSEAGSAVQVRVSTDGRDIDLVVSDHGVGIPAADLDRIFERFYRVDQARSRRTGGTGLGLAIVRHVALNHGGAIQVDSRLGEGSAFTLRLPSASSLVAVDEIGREPVGGDVEPGARERDAG